MKRTQLAALKIGDVFYMGFNPNMEHPYKILNIRYYIAWNHYDCIDLGNDKHFGMSQNLDIFVWVE
jgi:hypothetical protein